MKKTGLFLFILVAIAFAACKKANYAEGTVSPIVALLDVRQVYKGQDVVLDENNLNGARQIVGVVISDAASGNSPSGILVIQNLRRNALRGISLSIGAAAANYAPGDSLVIDVAGATLTRVNGAMRITGVQTSAINKVATGKAIKVQAINTATLQASPDTYESTLVTVSNAVLEPEPVTGDTFVGDKVINDGFGKMTVHTEATASYSKMQLPGSANITGIVLGITANNTTQLQLWPRKQDDIFPLALIKPSPVIITGYLTDPTGADNNQEYIQLMATRDIDFSVTNFSIVTCNNAGTNPAPANGWANGGSRTYKINLTSGKVSKGKYFYVGGNKNIWGAGTTDISAANWISSTQYSSVDGADFGTATTNLLANSGNVAGMAVFSGTKVDLNSVPLDVVMYGGNGTVYAAGPPEIGYRITNTDYYSTINPVTRATQNFYGGGTNTGKLVLPATGAFSMLGGVYDATTGRWVSGRSVTSIPLTKTSQLTEIEQGTSFTKLQN